MAYVPGRDDEPGNQYRVAYAAEAGDLSIDGKLTVEGDVEIHGDLLLINTTTVDVLSSTIYTFQDPIIDLNTSLTAPLPILDPGAGIRIFRGDPPIKMAQILYTETGGINTWRVGLEDDMLRVGRIADAMTDQRAMYWNDADKSVVTHASITFAPGAPGSATFDAPVFINTPTGGTSSYVQFVDAPGVTFSIQNKIGLGVDDAFVFQFQNSYTYDSIVFSNAPDLSTSKVMRFSLNDTPTSGRNRYIFDGVASFGIDTDSAALIRSDTDPLRIEGTNNLYFRIGGAGANQIELDSATLTLGVDLDMNSNDIINAASLDVQDLTIERLNVNVPTGIDPIPVVLGWGGSLTYSGTTYTVSTAPITNRSMYEINIAYSYAGPPPFTSATLVVPIYLGTDMDKVRAIYGVHRQMSAPGGSVTQVYVIPPGDVWIQDPFALPPDLTLGDVTGYHFLSINVVKKVGDWELLLTVVTQLP